jgi:dihydroneopterin aldolase
MTTLPARIRLRGIQLTSRIGVALEERKTPRLVVADIAFSLPLPLEQDGRVVDHLASTVDYAAIYRITRRVAAAHPFHLLETLTAEIHGSISEAFPQIRMLRVVCSKPAPPVGGDVVAAEVEIGGEGVLSR